MFDCLEIRAAKKDIVSEVEEKFEISSAAQKTLERIVRKIAGRQSKPNLTCAEKANVVFFHLHPNFAR